MAVNHEGRLGSNADLVGATTIVVTLTAGLGVGNVATLIACSNSVVTLTGVADSRGNTWAVHGSGGSTIPGIASTKVATALQIGDTVTVTWSGSGNRRAAAVDGWSGLDPLDWFDATAADATTENDATMDTPTVAPAVVPALLIGACYGSGSTAGRTFTADGTYTELPEVTVNNGVTYLYLFSEWKRVTTAGSYDATGSIVGGAMTHAERIAAFSEPAAAVAGRSAQAIFLGL